MDEYQQLQQHESRLTELGTQLALAKRALWHAQAAVTKATADVAAIEEQLRTMTAGQLHSPHAARLPLPVPGEDTRMINQQGERPQPGRDDWSITRDETGNVTRTGASWHNEQDMPLWSQEAREIRSHR